jgi:hypothetical protein
MSGDKIPKGLQERMTIEAQMGPVGSSNKVQVDLWRILQGAEDAKLTHMSFPVAKVRAVLEYIDSLEKKVQFGPESET